MALSAGTRLGPYEIRSALGAGGMGEVYRAHDTKLNRDIAIKVLLPAVANDPERLARFSREAQVLGALNHPNIAAIYGLEDTDGTAALVLELVEGPTLAERIALGPIAVAEALPIAKQMADALEAAHEQGIIHRDLKPANIKVKADGTVKVLDFGLAKAIDPPAAASADAMNSPTLNVHGTEAGIILGTAAYMSPEQARGKVVDKRADIWAFGCVLFEMLTGQLAFAGDTTSDTIAAVLGREPDWIRLPDTTPPGLRRLLYRCLEKDPRRRLRDIGDARVEIEEVHGGSTRDDPVPQSGSRRRERLAWMSALALVAVTAAMAAIWALGPAPPAGEMRVEITTPPTRDPVSLAISPDGQKIVFVATSDAQSRLWLRSLTSGSAQPLADTDAARLPFWSPDSRSVGFFADGKVKRIDIGGGSATVLANAPLGQGGAWHRDGVMIFAPTPASPLLQIPATGGAPATVTTVQAPQQVGHGFPQFLPDGHHFLYYVEGAPDARGVYVGQLGGAETTRLVDADAAAVYAPSGHVLFVLQRTLLAQDFDPVRLTLAGSPFLVADNVAVNRPSAALSASNAGPIIYRIGTAFAQPEYIWFDQSGKEISTVARADTNATSGSGPSLSPDGRRAALFRQVGGNIDLWVIDLERGALTRITVDAADDIFPIWSPDGTRLAFSSTRHGSGSLDLYLKSATGTGKEELLLATPQIKAASDWSPDGRFLLYSSPGPKTEFDIWTLPVEGDRKPFPIVQTRSNEHSAQFSPDGQWIAYESNESGRSEIYVQRFVASDDNAAGKVPVSTTGGAQVRWRRDGKALLYIALDDRLMTVPIRFASNGQALELGAAVPLFATRVLGGALQGFPQHQYSVSRDGQRFLMIVEREDTPTAPITVVLNWAGRRQN